MIPIKGSAQDITFQKKIQHIKNLVSHKKAKVHQNQINSFTLLKTHTFYNENHDEKGRFTESEGESTGTELSINRKEGYQELSGALEDSTGKSPDTLKTEQDVPDKVVEALRTYDGVLDRDSKRSGWIGPYGADISDSDLPFPKPQLEGQSGRELENRTLANMLFKFRESVVQNRDTHHDLYYKANQGIDLAISGDDEALRFGVGLLRQDYADQIDRTKEMNLISIKLSNDCHDSDTGEFCETQGSDSGTTSDVYNVGMDKWSDSTRNTVFKTLSDLQNKYGVKVEEIVATPSRGKYPNAAEATDSLAAVDPKQPYTIYIHPQMGDDNWIKDNINKDSFISKTVADVLTHEYGHILEGELEQRHDNKALTELSEPFEKAINNPTERDTLRRDVSYYGGENTHEAIAEAFLQHEKGTRNMFSDHVGNTFDKLFGKGSS